ncbi:MAG: ABC transporter permease [Coriobacteriia bacterium]|nr:ABC transporter permease [Coriobacteriia bacterium]
MSLRLTWKLLKKDLAMGPRSPFFLYALLLPVVMTVVLQFAFGSLFSPQPRLGIVDTGNSEITASIREMDGIDLKRLTNPAELKSQVEKNDLDAGLILPGGFDQAVKAGEKPDLQFFVGGESYASNRIILMVTAIDRLREVEGAVAPVKVNVVDFGQEGLPISVRLVPIIVFYALVMAGLFVPGSSLVEEKEQGTLMALLVTPVRTGNVLAAKWMLGTLFAAVMATVTLAMNNVLGANWVDVMVVVLIAGALSSMIGITVGVFAKDSTVLFGTVKGMGIFLFAPSLFYIFPQWPQWIARIFPLYWVIEPIWRVSVMGGSIVDVWSELSVAVGITVAMVPLVMWLARRMQSQMAAG